MHHCCIQNRRYHQTSSISYANARSSPSSLYTFYLKIPYVTKYIFFSETYLFRNDVKAESFFDTTLKRQPLFCRKWSLRYFILLETKFKTKFKLHNLVFTTIYIYIYIYIYRRLLCYSQSLIQSTHQSRTRMHCLVYCTQFVLKHLLPPLKVPVHLP